MTPHFRKLSTAAALAAVAAAAVPAAAQAGDRADDQTTALISRSVDGKMPNGPSTHAVISNDRRYARIIAFESEASDLVRGDTNGLKDVFAVRRGGSINNVGTPWRAGSTVLISRTKSGAPANGPSFGAAVDGGFDHAARCVAFLSSASNIVGNDTNGVDDAFVASVNGGAPRRVSLPGGRQATQPTTAVAVSGDCKRIAFVTGGKLYVKKGARRAKLLKAPGTAADPSFSTGRRFDLVFGADRGVYLSKRASRRPKLVAPGGRNPAYNDIKRRVLTYEVDTGGHTQIGYKDLGHGQRIISSLRGHQGNGDSRDPVIGNSGYYVTFETDAGNLGVNSLARAGDTNGMPDVYLFTDVRDLTLVQSTVEKAVPLDGGGQHPSMSFYANYIVFDSTLPLRGPAGDLIRSLVRPGAALGTPQIYMRYLGAV